MRQPAGMPGRVRCLVYAGLVGWSVLAGMAGAQQPSATSASTDVAAGKQVYTERCAHCHGDQGDGQGPAASVVYPKPRDFTSGIYKFRTRHENANGIKMASDEDILRSISEGLHGTSMPAWNGLLTKQQMGQLVQYIKTFASVFQEEKLGPALEFSGEIAPSPESIARGKALFEDGAKDSFKCYECHGKAGRGDGPRATEGKGLQDDWGERIWPANLTRPWTYRGGHARRDIFRNIAMGIRGTPMDAFIEPALLEVLRADDPQKKKEAEAEARKARENAWHVVNYVQSLWTHAEEPEAKSVLTVKLVDGPLPTAPDDPLWQTVPTNYYPLVGQVVEDPRLFHPLVTGMEVQALHNGKDIAFRITWDDRTESKAGGSGKTQTYIDAAALQFPATPLKETERPYFLMGDAKHPTDLWYWRNDPGTAVVVQTKGAKTFQPTDEQGGLRSLGVFDKGQYRVVMQRALRTKKAETEAQFAVGKFLPFTMTVWDGANGETGGGKRTVTAWYNLYLESEPSKAPLYLAFLGLVVGIVIEFSALYVTRKNHGQSDTARETGRS